jgi:hypothetical protein
MTRDLEVALTLVLVAAVVIACVRGRRTCRLHLVADRGGNEALLLDAHVAGRRSLFLLDTAYAGAPVLSTSFLAVEGKCVRGSVQGRYATAMELLRNDVSEDDRHAALDVLLRGGRCRAYTSGCTMRLMGIGETTEAQADMLLCPALSLDGVSTAAAPSADVFVTNPLRGSPHILTTDYLLHRAPCVLSPKRGTLRFRAAPLDSIGFTFFPARLVGGAFAVTMTVGEVDLSIVVDTGASAPLSVAASAVKRLRVCGRPDEPQRVTQGGVNGERVCSDVLHAPVRIGTLDMGRVPVFANSHEVQGADGYAGMGLLRALDLWMEPGRLGLRRSGLEVTAPSVAKGKCAANALPACAR